MMLKTTGADSTRFEWAAFPTTTEVSTRLLNSSSVTSSTEFLSIDSLEHELAPNTTYDFDALFLARRAAFAGDRDMEIQFYSSPMDSLLFIAHYCSDHGEVGLIDGNGKVLVSLYECCSQAHPNSDQYRRTFVRGSIRTSTVTATVMIRYRAVNQSVGSVQLMPGTFIRFRVLQ